MSLFPENTENSLRWTALKPEELAKPWTTARCHRLLRPLVSRIASLRKEKSKCYQTTEQASIPTSGTVATLSTRSSRRHEEPDADSDWLMPRKKRPRLTYSQRRGSLPVQSQPVDPGQSHPGQSSQDDDTGLASGLKSGVKRPFRSVQPERLPRAAVPGEIAVATPLLRRARGVIAISPVALAYETDSVSSQSEPDHGRRTKARHSAQKRLDERLLSLRKAFPHQYVNLEAIYRSLEALLKATAPSNAQKPSASRGPRSLLEMCLRKVPPYIVELEAWEKLEAKQSGTISTLDEINTSAQIYNELESMGTNVGWRHLRVVVRADGMSAVREGIEEGIFVDEFSQLLIDLCVQLGAVDEAEDLVAALIDRQYPQPASTDSHLTLSPVLQPLVQLDSFAMKNQRTPFLFRQISSLLSSGSLPRDWLVTSGFEHIWSLATQALASTDHCWDAMEFITQSISLLYSRKPTLIANAAPVCLESEMAKANQRTIMSSLSILASMRLLGETELHQPHLSTSDNRRIRIIGNRLRHVIRACLNAFEGYRRGRDRQSLDVLYLTLFLSSSKSQGEKVENNVRGGISKLSSSLEAILSANEHQTSKKYDDMSWLIASIARAYGRGTSAAPQQCLDKLFKRLKSLEIDQDVLDKLKTAAAFLIAQQTSNVRDLIYAESLHQQGRSTSDASTRQQRSGTLFTGYRWEETIGEWVTVSPVKSKRRDITPKHNPRASILSLDTEDFLTSSTNTVSLVSAKRRATGISPEDKSRKVGECSTGASVGHGNGEQGMLLKKRPTRFRNLETPTTSFTAKGPVPQQKLVFARSSIYDLTSQPGPGKENQVRLLAKKARRSSGRIVLGTRSLSCDRRDNYQDGGYSEDELCI